MSFSNIYNRISKLFSYLGIALKGTENDFTTGGLNRAIVILSVPMILEMTGEALFAVVDVFFVGRVSVNAVATLGLTEAVLMLVYSIAVGLSMAATAMVARRVGEHKPKEAAEAAVQSIILAVMISAVICVVGGFYSDRILKLMGGTPDLIAEGSGYTKIMLMGNFSIMLLFLLNAIFRGAGNAALAMRSLLIANGCNLILDPCFIFGLGPFPQLGVAGAAVATNTGRTLGVAYQLYHLGKGTSVVKIAWHQMTLQRDLMIRLIKVSVGGVSQYLIGSASWIFLMRIVAIFGTDIVAGYTFATRIIFFTILPSWGLANAAATLVGQNLGAKQPGRAEKSVWNCALYNMYFLAIIAVVFGYWAEEFVGVFTDEAAVLDFGAISLRYICFGYIFFAYGMVINQAFNGAGDTRTPTLISLFSYWLFELPLAYWMSVTLNWGPKGVLVALALSIAAYATASVVIFRRGKWKTVQI